MKTSLVKIKIVMEYEVVGHNIYHDKDLNKVAQDIWRNNRDDIIPEATEYGAITVTGTSIKSVKDLAEGYDASTIPWAPNISFGNNKSDRSIGELLLVGTKTTEKKSKKK